MLCGLGRTRVYPVELDYWALAKRASGKSQRCSRYSIALVPRFGGMRAEEQCGVRASVDVGRAAPLKGQRDEVVWCGVVYSTVTLLRVCATFPSRFIE